MRLFKGATLSLKKFTIFSVFAFLILAGSACGAGNGTPGAPKQITLEWWTVFKEPTDLTPVIDAYRARFPHIRINVKTLRYEEYEDTLINALAEDRGPDILTFHNTATGKYLTKLAPMPEVTTVEKAVQKGSIKKQTFTEKQQFPSFSNRYMESAFVDQVIDDVKVNGKIYGLPLSMDSLALFYNKSLLNAAGIPIPAGNYAQLQEHSIKLTKKNRVGDIIQSGVALGTSNNIERFEDIISLLMMQNGTEMIDDRGSVAFQKMPALLQGRSTLPAVDAISFYSDFADPSRQVYTWNEEQASSLESFMQGKLGYFFGYSYHIPIIQSQAPKLNFAVTKVPQIDGNPEINFANYWIEGVSKKSKHIDEAWNFLQFISRAENVKSYLDLAQQPTALKSLIEQQIKDTTIGIFVEQALTAKSWYHGDNPDIVPLIFSQMLNDLRSGNIGFGDILFNASNKIQQTIP